MIEFYHMGEKIFSNICNELMEWMEKNNYEKIEDIVGLALKK